MKSYSSRELIKILEENGWYEVRCIGDHHQFKNDEGKLTTVTHPIKTMPINNIKSISKQTRIKFE